MSKKVIEPYMHKVQYYETDQMAIVHHSNYIRWFEEARVDFLDKIGYGYKAMEEQGIISPVTGVSCEYKSMTRFGDTVRIAAKVLEFNGIRLRIGYQIYDAATNELRSQGESQHCFINPEGKIVSVKRANPEFYNCLKGYAENNENNETEKE
ncbi:MAG: acyl-CoA thioesterase [Lachnospiraceae bacterium]|nr:acyl-CoA thioesterase [Lachnospiraceae bacterium]